jgi:pimeloyl-ACP methyl ester carboxylesterase
MKVPRSIKSTSKKSMPSPILEKQYYRCDDEGKQKIGLVGVGKTCATTVRLLILGLLTAVIIFRHMSISQFVIDLDSENVSPLHFGLASSALHWIPCGSRFQCANLSVPLNHLNHSDKRTASIAITRYLSSVQDFHTGTLIFNPGGPGGSGTGATYRLGPLLDTVLQGRYNILGFDPRGINKTLPAVHCLSSRTTRSSLQHILGSTAPSLHLHDVGIWDAIAQLLADECSSNSGADILPYVNTPTVARDIAAIVDALRAEHVPHRRHHPVSYWGFSYGTNLGAIFTAMFPNKLHRIILDGIRSPFDAREIYTWGYTSLASQNDMVEGYFEICERVGRERCPLAGGLEGEGAKEAVMDLLMRLYERPLPVISSGSGQTAGLVTFYDYKEFFYGILYWPRNWRRFADISMDLLRGNGTSFLRAVEPGPGGYGSAESGTAVLCTDAVQATNYSLSSWKEFVRNMTELSFVAGDSRSLDTLPCRHWGAVPNERWLGDFEDIELQVPVLMIGNTYDPATPLASAKRLLGKMGKNAVLLEQRSYGHCSVSAVSSCTYNTTLDYLLNGNLPEDGKVCDVDDEEYGDYFPRSKKHTLETSSLHQLLAGVRDEIRRPS